MLSFELHAHAAGQILNSTERSATNKLQKDRWGPSRFCSEPNEGWPPGWHSRRGAVSCETDLETAVADLSLGGAGAEGFR